MPPGQCRTVVYKTYCGHKYIDNARILPFSFKAAKRIIKSNRIFTAKILRRVYSEKLKVCFNGFPYIWQITKFFYIFKCLFGHMVSLLYLSCMWSTNDILSHLFYLPEMMLKMPQIINDNISDCQRFAGTNRAWDQ